MKQTTLNTNPLQAFRHYHSEQNKSGTFMDDAGKIASQAEMLRGKVIHGGRNICDTGPHERPQCWVALAAHPIMIR